MVKVNPKILFSDKNIKNAFELAQFKPTIIDISQISDITKFLRRKRPQTDLSLNDAKQTLILFPNGRVLSNIDIKNESH
jgi:hypothetical protein